MSQKNQQVPREYNIAIDPLTGEVLPGQVIVPSKGRARELPSMATGYKIEHPHIIELDEAIKQGMPKGPDDGLEFFRKKAKESSIKGTGLALYDVSAHKRAHFNNADIYYRAALSCVEQWHTQSLMTDSYYTEMIGTIYSVRSELHSAADSSNCTLPIGEYGWATVLFVQVKAYLLNARGVEFADIKKRALSLVRSFEAEGGIDALLQNIAEIEESGVRETIIGWLSPVQAAQVEQNQKQITEKAQQVAQRHEQVTAIVTELKKLDAPVGPGQGKKRALLIKLVEKKAASVYSESKETQGFITSLQQYYHSGFCPEVHQAILKSFMPQDMIDATNANDAAPAIAVAESSNKSTQKKKRQKMRKAAREKLQSYLASGADDPDALEAHRRRFTELGIEDQFDAIVSPAGIPAAEGIVAVGVFAAKPAADSDDEIEGEEILVMRVGHS